VNSLLSCTCHYSQVSRSARRRLSWNLLYLTLVLSWRIAGCIQIETLSAMISLSCGSVPLFPTSGQPGCTPTVEHGTGYGGHATLTEHRCNPLLQLHSSQFSFKLLPFRNQEILYLKGRVHCLATLPFGFYTWSRGGAEEAYSARVIPVDHQGGMGPGQSSNSRPLGSLLSSHG